MSMVKIVEHSAGRTVGLTFPKKPAKKQEAAEKPKKQEADEKPDTKTAESAKGETQEE